MRVSVVMPVYNARRYVRQAVESALSQPETAEIILVEDGSPDNGADECERLAREFENVRLFYHPGKTNRGAAASRNLGIRQAGCDLIAFLDADDYYLPGRFTLPCQVLGETTGVDGVHEAVRATFENEAAEKRFFASRTSATTGMAKPFPPEHLLEALLTPRNGNIHLNGLVVRKALLHKVGLFDDELYLHQDTALCFKLAAMGTLVPGRLTEPVAIRRVHGENRIFNQPSNYRRMWNVIRKWTERPDLPSRQRNLILQAIAAREFQRPEKMRGLPRYGMLFANLLLIGLRSPKLLLAPVFWHRFAALLHGRRGV